MKSNDDQLARPEDLAQLLRLRQVQVEKAEDALRQGRRSCEDANRAVEAAVRKVHDDVSAIQRFADYMVGDGARELARLGEMFSGYRAVLNDTLVKSQVQLQQDREALEAAEAALGELQAAWLGEIARRDAVESALRRSRAAQVLEAERLAEAELEDLHRMPGVGVPIQSEPRRGACS